MNFKRLAGVTLTMVLALFITPKLAFATDKTDVLAAAHQYFDNLDNDHLQKALGMCNASVTIIDEFPPHEWSGTTACADWWKALNAYNDKNGITEAVAKLGVPWSVDVNGDRAYAVIPATYTYKQNGKTVTESRSVWTVVLERTSAGWRITAWTWSKH